MNPDTQYRLGLILVTGAALAWSTAGYFTRLIPLDNWTLLFWRGLFAAIGIFAFMLVKDGRDAWRQFGRLRGPGWLFAIISGAGMIAYITALTLTTVAHVAIIYCIVPFVAAALAFLLMRERPTLVSIAASCVALIGVAVMVRWGGGEGSLLGDFLALLMTVGLAAMMVISRQHRDIPIMAAACLSAILSSAAAWPMIAAVLPPLEQLFQLALFGLVNSAIGIVLFTLGARLIPAVETALITALDAPLAPVWVWLAFGETPGRATILGGALVLAAVLANISLGARSRALAN
ncbi:DMT family transporter [Dongia sp.]|uniref:DMT family transporter n=1 Tax=Dongia sp. TaxID=1977262 RepID=UPI00375141AE